MNAVASSLPFSTRVWFAWVCFVRVLFDGAFAARAWDARNAVPAGSAPAPAAETKSSSASVPPAPAAAASTDSALQLLALFQREGRLIDFLQQDVTAFADADIGAAARVVHDGCRKALASHVEIRPVRDEREGGPVTLESVDANAVKLVGNVSGTAPFRGTLRHRGWRAASVTLPRVVEGHDARVLAPAEVEL